MVGRRVCLAMALALGLLPVSAAKAQSVPDAPDSLARAGNAIVLTLPDSGGYAINRQPVSQKSLAAEFSAIYGPRPRRVLLISWGASRARDVPPVVDLARERGITIYRIHERGEEL
jgi:biopolymer transport protein ExbD